MKTTTLAIENDYIKAFINALDEVGCRLISQKPISDWTTEIEVSYEYAHNLFYLATIMSINKKLEEFNTTLRPSKS